MDRQTQRALGAINRAFYDREADSFDASRNHPWPGWERVLTHLPLRLRDEALKVLDVGCGNGRFLDYLTAQAPPPLEYMGCDASEPLLALARQRHPHRRGVRLVACDFVEGEPDATLPCGRFDLVTLFGVMHHVPAFERRRALLESLTQRLEPGGLLAIAFWRFAMLARFQRRIQPWETWSGEGPVRVDISQLEPGDHLLRWGEGEGTSRYCHFVDDDECSRLVDDLPLDLVDSFASDGRSQDLNLYVLLRRRRAESTPV